MADSTISSLGLGSDGALSYDVIDQLRAVDEDAIIKPIDNKISQNETQAGDLSILTTLTATLKASTSTLADDMTYLQTSVTSSSDSVSVTAESGVSPQDFTLDVQTLAKQDIYQSNSFTAENSTFTNTDDTINFNIDGNDYQIDVTATTTLEELKGQIYDVTDGKITASLLNVGGDTPYKLVLKSTDTGVDNAITVTSTGGGTAISDLGFDVAENHIQSATNAEFTYNNVSITRSTNTIDDLIVGVNINLNDIGSSNISIKQDTSTITNGVQSFVDSYNELMNNLAESTKYDSETELAGTFQSSSEIKSLQSDMRRQLLIVDDQGRSISDYGVTINDAGLLEFDSSILDSKLSSDPSDVEAFFNGTSETKGYFTKYNNVLDSYINSDNGVLTLYSDQLTNSHTSLEENRQKSVDRLDAKYDTMVKRFASYDAVIGNLNAEFESLSMMINQSYANN
jgi:flagellar hook-associated protein 2